MMKTFRSLPACTLLAATALMPATACRADGFSVGSAFEDAKEYVTAPIRWDLEDWTYFGITAAAVAAAHQYDSQVQSHFGKGSRAVLNGQDKHSTRDALPAVALVAATGVYAGLLGDHDGYNETWSLLEAGVFSTATGEVMKFAAGRERPNDPHNVTISPDEWRHGGSSFPSVHASAAFAIGTVFAESGNDEYRWIRRILGYGVAGGTAFIRIRDNVHWLSDTVAGAAVGIATARFVLNRTNWSSHPVVQFQPTKDGWMVSYTVSLH